MGVKQLLKDYEDRFPDGTIPEISLAITNQTDRSVAAVSKTLSTQLATGFANTDIPNTADVRYRVRQWKQLCAELNGLDQQHLQLRKYETRGQTQDQPTPQRAAATDSRLVRPPTCVGEGSVTAYTLPSGKRAIVLRRAPRSATTTRSQRGRHYRGSFEVFFTERLTAFYTQQLKPLGWRCPDDVPPSEPRSTQTR